MNDINEWKNYPQIDDNWSEEKKEEYKRLIDINIGLTKMNSILDQIKNDPNTEIKKEKYLRLKREGKL